MSSWLRAVTYAGSVGVSSYGRTVNKLLVRAIVSDSRWVCVESGYLCSIVSLHGGPQAPCVMQELCVALCREWLPVH